MAEPDLVENWQNALALFQDAEGMLQNWRAGNPHPWGDDELETQWEEGFEAVAKPYDIARSTLEKTPAPDLDAVILKLKLLRNLFEGEDNADVLDHRAELIERDLKRLAKRA